MKVLLRVTTALVLALVLGLGAGCGPSAEDEASSAYDESIHELQASIASFYTLGPDVPAEAAGIGIGRITDAWLEVQARAEAEEGADLAAASAAYDTLAAATEALAEDDPKPMDTLMPLVQAFQAEVEELHSAGGFH